MDKEDILTLLRVKTGKPNQSAGKETINRLAAALTAPASFAELERELPPVARYLGPSAWMDAIQRGQTQPEGTSV
ncbi:MAG: hypothetical protein LBH70_00950 [Spirochaetaceae bacterium]|jgi:hypothetical protein|nr:hypothetical protein [Spirochaetaceae bacterium]